MRAILTRRLAGPAVIAVAVTAMTLAGTAAQAAPQASGAATASAYTPPSGVTDPCPPPAPDDAGCAALIRPAASLEGRAAAPSKTAASTVTPAGYSPSELQSAYDLNSSLG